MPVITASQISLSTQGAEFMVQPSFDSFRAFPYKDSGGLWTIGYGTRITPIQANGYVHGIDEAQGMEMFEASVSVLLARLKKMPLAGLTQGQNDAIVSLAYNIGINEFAESTIYKQLINRAIDLGSWNWFVKDAKGITQPGLVRRRQLELKLFIWGIYTTAT